MPERRSYDFFDEQLQSRLERLHLLAKRSAAHRRSGARRSRRIGDGLEFADHRGYAPGDDIRFIDWAYYARMEKLLLRLVHEHSESEVLILVDSSASMGAGAAKFNYCRRAAAALAYVAMGSLERVSLRAFSSQPGRSVRAGRRREEIFDVLEFLDALTSGGKTDLRACAARIARSVDTSATVLLLSDLLDCGDDIPDAMAMLRAKQCSVTVLHVYSPADAEPAMDGAVLLEQSETAERMSVNVTKQLRESYRKCWTVFQKACEKACLAHGAAYIAAPTDLPFEQLVLRSLQQAGVLAS